MTRTTGAARATRDLATASPIGRKRRGAWLVAGLATSGLLLSACSDGGEVSDDPAEFYKGEDIRIIVPSSPGGGQDTAARLLAPLLAKHIPGEPTILVENRDGGGNLTGTNYFAAQEPDGLTLGITSASANQAYVLGDPNVDYDYADWYGLIGFPDSSVTYASADTGIEEPADVLDPDEDLYFLAGDAPSEMISLIVLDQLEVPFESIFGFGGAGEANIAFEGGEGNITTYTSLSYKEQIVPRVEDGEVVPLFNSGTIVDGEIANPDWLPSGIPGPLEFAEAVTGETPTGPAWDALKLAVGVRNALGKVIWVDRDVPEAALEALRQGVEGLLADPEDSKTLIDGLDGIQPSTGDSLQSNVDSLANADEESKQWLRDYLEDRWDVAFE